MNRHISFIWGAAVLLVLCPSAWSKEWSIVGLDLLPNRPQLTRDSSVQLLSDGALTRHPAWGQATTAGWHRLTPVTVALELGRSLSTRAVEVQIHAIRYSRAGVMSPRRIDVYRGHSSGAVRHVATMTSAPTTPSGESPWIRIRADGTGAHVSLVIHADQTNIFIDDIRIAALDDAAPVEHADELYTNAKQDSLQRLRNQVSQDECSDGHASTGAFPSGRIESWLTADALDALPTTPAGATRTTQIGVSGLDSEMQVVALGIYSAVPARVRVASRGSENSPIIEWFRAERVMSSSGRWAYDALLPISFPQDVRLAGCAQYFIGRIRPSEPGSRRAVLEIHSDIEPVRELIIDHLAHASHLGSLTEAINPFLVLTHAAQIGDPRQIIQQAHAEGVNVVMIPRHRVPQPGLSNEEMRATRRRLHEDLALLSDDTQILLSLGWQRRFAPGFLTSDSAEQRHRTLAAWLQKLTRDLASAGVATDRWALHVIDEPVPEEIEWVVSLLEQLHRAAPDVRKYVTLSAAPDTKERDLFFKAVAQTSTLLQIRSDAATQLRESITELGAEWWVYSVPPEPSKNASPMLHYAMPAWIGWALGARGTGTWGYADTRGGSAWDDLDGVTSDWSLWYERKAQSPVPSRRWLGFQQGASDLRLLSGASALARQKASCASVLDRIRDDVLRSPPTSERMVGSMRKWRHDAIASCFLPDAVMRTPGSSAE